MEDRLLSLRSGIAKDDLDQESVQLGLGERIGAFELNRILGGKHGECR
jgi:hypothetical protein